MRVFLKQLLLRENVYWAWQKVRNAYRFDRTWYDELELAEFEATLDEQVTFILNAFRKDHYRLSPARPVPFPKKPDAEGNKPTRQMFWFRVRDQVAWMALLNVIGPALDSLMPVWSYGDRLYRSVWIDSETDLLKVGPYRHTNRLTYRAFKHSWPRYRRHIFLTIRAMAKSHRRDPLEEPDREFLTREQNLRAHLRVPYLAQTYWPAGNEEAYWAGLDLEKFFPSTPSNLIERQILTGLCQADRDYDGQLDQLISGMLKFEVDCEGWTAKQRRDHFDLTGERRQPYRQLPTGLLVSGFLSNVAMLGVDADVDEALRTHEPGDHHVAQFRYIDDHVVLSDDPDSLLDWIQQYQGILKEHNPAWQVNHDKTEPGELGKYFRSGAKQKGKRPASAKRRDEMCHEAVVAMRLNPGLPAPLLTQTVAKISTLAAARFELLDGRSQREVLDNLKLLMLADFGPQEAREDTRVSFAVAGLVRHFPEMSREGLSEEARLLECERVFLLLKEAVRKYPTKLSLPQRAIRFTRYTGSHGLKSLLEVATDRGGLNELTVTYCRAVFAQCLATEMLLALRVLRDEEAADEDRETSASFLRDATSVGRSLSVCDECKWYEKRAWAMYQGALAAAQVCFDELQKEALQPPDSGDLASRLVPYKRFWSNDGPSEAWWNSRTGQSLGTWAWWVEGALMPGASNQPSFIWRVAAPLVTAEDAVGLRYLARYPTRLDDAMIIMLLGPEESPAPRNPGWLLEILATRKGRDWQRLLEDVLPALEGECLAGGMAPQDLAQSLRPVRNRLRLTEWVQWQQSYLAKAKTEREFLERASDPRFSEWSAVKIAERIVSSLADVDPRKRTPIHPLNYLIPKQWSKGRPPIPWEDWRPMLEEGAATQVSGQVWDPRYMGLESPQMALLAPDWPWIQGIGLLLLGLLRREFSWPGLWNRNDQRLAYAYLTRSLVETLPCSSMTMAAVEGCLLPRSSETVLLADPIKETQIDADTVADPPVFPDLRSLSEFLSASLKVLEEHQLTGHGRRPCQLVPMSIRQLTRPAWSTHQPVPRGDES